MRRALFWSLVPVLLPQAIKLRKNAPRFAAAAGPTKGRVGHGESKRLLAIGDSIIAGVGATTLNRALVGQTARILSEGLHCEIQWQALGKIGITTEKMLTQLLPKLDSQPVDFILVSAGVNDVTSLARTPRWIQNLRILLKALARHSPEAKIAFAGLPPLHGFPLLPQPLRALLGMRARTFDRAAQKEIARHDHVGHVPILFDPDPALFAADGFHPSEVSYQTFGEAMAAELIETHRKS